jgi:uncharacterized membrane protein (TIGR02234 family)
MAADPLRRGRLMIHFAQSFLVLAAAGLWAASRLPWVAVKSFDGLGQPKMVTLNGAAWSTALLPLALLLVVAAVAALAVRGRLLRGLAVVVAAVSLATGYLAISLWVVRDVAVRAADLSHVSVLTLVGSQRYHTGAAIALTAAVGALTGAVLLMRSASRSRSPETAKYAAPAARRSLARRAEVGESERMIWDALDEGRDPTDTAHPAEPEPDTEGR